MPDSSNVAAVEDAWARFAGLSPRDAAVILLARASHGRQLQRGEVLVAESDNDTDVFLITAGRLRTVRLLDDGQEVWLADAEPGDLIGELAALTGQKRTSTVVAASRVHAFAINRQAFLSVAEKHGSVALALARLLARRLVQTSGHMTDLFGKEVLYRVHSELVRLGTPSQATGELVRLSAPPTITDLRQRVHAGREATSRAMSELEARGLVVRKDGVWIVLALPED